MLCGTTRRQAPNRPPAPAAGYNRSRAAPVAGSNNHKTLPMRLRDALDLLLLAALWGASFLFTRIAAPVFGPYPVTALRVGVAAALLVPLVLFNGLGRQAMQRWKPLALVGLLNSALPFLCYGYAALTLPAGVSALLNATTPLWGAVVAWLWLGDKPGVWRSAGLAIGFAGASMLFWTPLPDAAEGRTLLAFLAALLAPLSYGISASYAQRYLQDTPAMVNAAGSLASATVFLALPAALHWPSHAVPWQAWVSVLLLGVFSTACAYLLFFRLLARIGPVRAVTVTYLVPLFGVTWGALLLREPVTPNMVAAGVVILIGTAFATGMVGKRAAAT